MKTNNKTIVLLSPFIIIAVDIIVAIIFGKLIGKWAFAPIILFSWLLFAFFIFRFGGKNPFKNWLKPPEKSWGYTILALFVGLIPLPIFLRFSDALEGWTIWLPWLILFLVNPWLEEGYWRGLLLDYTKEWKEWWAILFTSTVFAAHHIAFGINSEVNSGIELLVATFIMGVVWAIVYLRTKSLRWCIVAHILVDCFNLSVAAFLDLFSPGNW